MLTQVGLKREDIYTVNTVLCRPPENRTPYEDERDLCFGLHSGYEITHIYPEVVVAMGSSAIKACCINFKTIKETRGQIFQCCLPKICSWHTAVILTFHPASLLSSRHPENIPLFLEDLEIAKKYKRN